jgi:hypothetical protein
MDRAVPRRAEGTARPSRKERPRHPKLWIIAGRAPGALRHRRRQKKAACYGEISSRTASTALGPKEYTGEGDAVHTQRSTNRRSDKGGGKLNRGCHGGRPRGMDGTGTNGLGPPDGATAARRTLASGTSGGERHRSRTEEERPQLTHATARVQRLATEAHRLRAYGPTRTHRGRAHATGWATEWHCRLNLHAGGQRNHMHEVSEGRGRATL